MKKIILLPFLVSVIALNAQPKLVGSMSAHGAQNGGSLFRVDLPGTSPGIIHSFDNTAPHLPKGGVIAGDGNWMYGMINYTGTPNNGALYKIMRDGSNFTIISVLDDPSAAFTIPNYHTDGHIYFNNGFSFKKLDPATNIITDLPLNGGVYQKNLLIDADDWIYFTTTLNKLAKIKTDGSQWTELHDFDATADGSSGFAGLTETPGDSLFGVQPYNGPNGGGTLYSIKKDGTGFFVHHAFENTTGIQPESRLLYFDGKLYGTTFQGGSTGNGVLYSINADGTNYRVLHNFLPGNIGFAPPLGNISIASNGRIFGSFWQHYSDGFTTTRLFKVDTSGDNFSTFFNVNQRENGHFNLDVLLQDNEENIFFPTAEMGRHEGGVFNRVDTSGFSGTGLFHFGTSLTGFYPTGALIEGSDGKIYGITKIGGVDGNGTIYSVNPDGTGYTKLHEFTDAQGYEPSGKLLEASDGKLYGTLQTGGATNAGGIYSINKNGTGFQIIYSFPDVSLGYFPVGGVVEDNTGALFGVTNFSLFGYGVIYKINKDGSNYTVLKTLDVTGLLWPSAGLRLYNDFLYGVTNSGGAGSTGGVFRIRRDGTGYSAIHEFSGPSDGANPASTPVLVSNGKLIGTTANGGDNFAGILYSMDPNGANYTILKQYSTSSDVQYPTNGVIQASDGLLYGFAGSSITPGFSSALYRINLNGSGFAAIREFTTNEGQLGSALLDLQGDFSLPVELLSFTAEKTEQSAELKWKTTQEQNSDRFEVERSANGVTFNTIGKVTAAGNSQVLTSYSFTDNNPLNGTNYYRLKQVDLDETYTWSKIVSVNFINVSKVTISPNPVPDRLTVKLPVNNRFTLVRILDATGKLMMQKNIAPLSTAVSMDVQQLAKGWYVLQLDGGQQERKLFIKQ